MDAAGESGSVHPTVRDDYIVSLLDGKRYKVLTHHLTRLGYTAASYR
jgi:predicted transcriptional regulator